MSRCHGCTSATGCDDCPERELQYYCNCGRISMGPDGVVPTWCGSCMTPTLRPADPRYRYLESSPNYVIKHEPRKQIWLPGLQAHLWIATMVMWIVTFTHPWQYDQLVAASVLFVVAMWNSLETLWAD